MRYLLSCLALCVFTAQAAVVDINSASASELARNLQGVGPAIAQRIIEFRQMQGPFPTADSIQLVPGVGQRTYERNLPLIQALPVKTNGHGQPPLGQGSE